MASKRRNVFLQHASPLCGDVFCILEELDLGGYQGSEGRRNPGARIGISSRGQKFFSSFMKPIRENKIMGLGGGVQGRQRGNKYAAGGSVLAALGKQRERTRGKDRASLLGLIVRPKRKGGHTASFPPEILQVWKFDIFVCVGKVRLLFVAVAVGRLIAGGRLKIEEAVSELSSVNGRWGVLFTFRIGETFPGAGEGVKVMRGTLRNGSWAETVSLPFYQLQAALVRSPCRDFLQRDAGGAALTRQNVPYLTGPYMLQTQAIPCAVEIPD
ncbi:hypothetical protein AAG570_009142 [Ranatra chinensis]|uniref:Uncharacterized protein n=1 Tax=Ranatra chinensis TaxID=642074 RepID=A0ABD0YSZ9_9HEMI